MKPKMYLVSLRSRDDKFIFFVHESLIDWVDSLVNEVSSNVIIPEDILNTHMLKNPSAKMINKSFLMSRNNGFNDFMIHLIGSSTNYESMKEAMSAGKDFEIVDEIEGVLY